jgi:hypothetical protein
MDPACTVECLVALAIGIAAVGSIVWFTLRLGIAPMPSSARACRAMITACENAPPGPVVDLGSGWGTLAIAFARRYPGRRVVGYELSWRHGSRGPSRCC